MVICLEEGTDLHMAQLMPLPLTVSCYSKIQIGFTFLGPAHPGSPGQRAVKRVCVCVLSLSKVVDKMASNKQQLKPAGFPKTTDKHWPQLTPAKSAPAGASRHQVKIYGVDRHGERGARAYNGGLEAERPPS